MSSADDQPVRVNTSVAESVPKPARRSEDEEAMLYCPVCNQRLAARQCKLICQRCGYYMSCADYY